CRLLYPDRAAPGIWDNVAVCSPYASSRRPDAASLLSGDGRGGAGRGTVAMRFPDGLLHRPAAPMQPGTAPAHEVRSGNAPGVGVRKAMAIGNACHAGPPTCGLPCSRLAG